MKTASEGFDKDLQLRRGWRVYNRFLGDNASVVGSGFGELIRNHRQIWTRVMREANLSPERVSP
jgi:hypothetical protein